MGKYISILNGGSIAGLVAFGWFLVLYLAMGVEYPLAHFDDPFVQESLTIRIHPFGGVRIFGVIIPIIFMYRAIKRYKIEEGEGFIRYGEAFQVGVMFTFIYSSLAAMMMFLFGSLIDASFVEFANTYDLRALEMLQAQGMQGLLDIDAQVEMLEQRGLSNLALTDFWQKTTSGFLIALIVAAVLKQKPPTFADDE